MAKLLLVDDDLDVMTQYKAALANTGHELTIAASATEARGLLKNFIPDLAVVDIMMEDGIPGFDLAREIHQKAPDCPILMVSSLNQELKSPADMTPDEKLPIHKFLDKPLTGKILVQEIEKALASRKKK
ncbi:MAG: response regulator [Elusimicrobiota bacterium]|jgi:two-component system OmpR family response regulator